MSDESPQSANVVERPDKKNAARDRSWMLPVVVGSIGTLLWLWFFTVGYCYVSYSLPVDFSSLASKPVEEINRTTIHDLLSSVGDFFVFSLIWRWTNLLYLAICASLIGEVGKWAGARRGRRGPRPSYAGAFVRGFYVFLLTLTGQVIIAGGVEPDRAGQTSVTPAVGGKVPPQSAVTFVDENRYFRLAGATSLLAFMGSFFPGFFRRLLARFDPEDQGTASPTANSSSKPPAG